MKEVIIPEGVASIGNRSFYSCDHLKELNLPSSITEIGEYALYGCGKLKTINFAGTEQQWSQVAIDSSNKWMFKDMTINFNCAPGK